MKRKVFAALLVIVIMSVFIGCNKEASTSSNGAENKQKSQKSVVLNNEEILSVSPSKTIEEPSTEKTEEKVSQKENIPEVTKSKEQSTKRIPEKSSLPSQSAQSTYIGAKKAKATALSHAGISEAEATFFEVELDRDDYIKKYEISFHYGDFEYDYEINAENGKIISVKKEYEPYYD